MLIPTIILGVLAFVLMLVGYCRGEAQHVEGLKSGFVMLVEILPLLLFAFVVAGMVQVLLPHEAIARWVGTPFRVSPPGGRGRELQSLDCSLPVVPGHTGRKVGF